MASLQEQLLKAGLTTKQKTRQANTDKRRKNKQQRSGVEHEISLQEQIKLDLAKSKQEKLQKDIELNADKQKVLVEKELQLRILQILQHHQLTNVKGESVYNYTFNKLIKKLYVDSITHNALVKGRLALCGLDDKTYIVTAETAAKLAELNAEVVLVQNDRIQDESIAEDDPYADYQIPDDLMW